MNACGIYHHVHHSHLDESLDAPKVNVGESRMSIVGRTVGETSEVREIVIDADQTVHSHVCSSELCPYVDAPAQAANARSVQSVFDAVTLVRSLRTKTSEIN